MKRIKPELKKFQYNNEAMKFNLGTLVISLFCVLLIIIATFTQIKFSHFIIPSEALVNLFEFIGENHDKADFLIHYEYIPQIPVIMFIAGLLGRRFATFVVAVYIIAGLTFLPIFALGGGIKYILQYNFGYIIAYLPAVWFGARILEKSFSFVNIAKASILGVLIIHAIGIFYLIFIALIKQDGFNFICDVIAVQSGVKIVYDFIFSYLLIAFSRFVKHILWLAMN